ncbi:thioredoxin family protein [Helicovermis profundi]|uniref:Thioredoxin family protein n=1 Tax=Helicovermis profundi TaxID=3065157 RepID=A0AAU9EKP3_9FIRM|nr:thioredoxin family protein [Clostridia bacterium S502]
MIKKLYNKGIKFEKFILNDESKHKEIMLKFSDNSSIDEGLKNEIELLNIKTKILVFGELWCPDCTVNISALQILSKFNKKIEFRILPRNGFENDIKELTGLDEVKIPTIIVMNNTYKIKGQFIERPQEILELENEENQVKRIVNMKEYRNGLYIGETIKEIIEIIKRDL